MKHPIFFLSLTFLAIVPAFSLPEGFEVTTFAEPFRVEYPTALTAAPDGTVYVSCDQNGSLGKDKGGVGKVVACRDTDGDGKADQFTDFVPEINSPRGGHFVGDTLFLIHPPYLSAFRDTDDDGVADEHKVLLENIGFGLNHPRGSDHTTNACRMGIDGWLYIAVGDFGMEGTTGTDGRTITFHGGGIARVRPDGTQLEIYSYNTRNNCDVAISPYLDLFTRDNTNDGKGWNIRVHHFTNGSEHGYPRLYKNFTHEAVKPMIDAGGGSGTGALYLHEPGFPGEIGDQLYTCDWTTWKIYQHPLERFEATFKAGEEVFMGLARAVDMDVDGESRLYVCDWRDGRFIYAGEGVKVGLVQRLTMKGMSVEAWPEIGTMEIAELVAQVGHRSAVRRLEAQWELLQRDQKESGPGLLSLAKDGEAPLYARVAAIFTYKQLLGQNANGELAGLVADEQLREFALRAMADRTDQLAGVKSEVFRSALVDADARVRLQGVIGLQRLGAKEAAMDIIELGAKTWEERKTLPDGEDYRIPHACVQALARIGAWEACLQAVGKEESRAVALHALQLMHEEKVVAGLGEILARAEEGSGLHFESLRSLARLYFQEGEWDKLFWWGTRPDDRGPYFFLAEWSETPTVKRIVEREFARLGKKDHSRYIEALVKNRIDLANLDLGEQDPLMFALGATELNSGHVTLLVEAAMDRQRNWDDRLKAYRALSRGDHQRGKIVGEKLKGRVKILGAWLKEKGKEEEAEREVTDFITSPALVLKLQDLHDVALQGNAQMSRVAWRAILNFSRSPLTKGGLKKKAVKMTKGNTRQVGFFFALADLKLTGFDEQIEEAINSDNDWLIEVATETKALLSNQASSGGKMVAELSADEVMTAAMEGKGDVENGKGLFSRQGCIACHAINQDAVQKGPYLGSAGGKFTRDYLIESVLDPNAVVAQGFQTELVTMKDGMVHMGFVTKEEDGIIELRNIAGMASEIKEEDVAKRDHQSTSMMPPGLVSGLSVGEFTDLVEYMVSLKE